MIAHIRTAFLFAATGILLRGAPCLSQTMRQVYPGHEVHDYLALVHWHGDTLFVAGNNSGFQRSIDAGRTWHPVFSGNTGYDFVRMGANASGVYLLPAPSLQTEAEFADTTSMFIFKYDPRTSDTTRIVVPCPIPDHAQIGSLFQRFLGNRSLFSSMSVTRDGLFIVQSVKTDSGGSQARRLSLLYKREGASDWSVQFLPDSMACAKPSIFFRDADTGVLINRISKFSSGVFVTVDGGRTWRRMYSDPLPSWPFIGSVDLPAQWVDDTTFIMPVSEYALGKSTNLGATWDTMSSASISRIATCSFLPDGNGIVCGQLQEIAKTTDFGTTWSIVHDRYYAPSATLLLPVLVNPSQIVAAGYGGYIYATTDGGVTWDAPLMTEKSHRPIFFANDEDGLALSFSDFENTFMEYGATSDGGATWTKRFTRTDNIPYALPIPVDENQIWALQQYPKLSDTLVYLSLDGGVHWTGVCRQSTIGAMTFPAEVNGNLVCGADSFMVYGNRGILRTLDRGATWELRAQIQSLLPDTLDMTQSFMALYCQDPRFQWFITGDRVLGSTDFGATWKSILSLKSGGDGSFPIQAAIAPDGMTLFMRTAGAGVQHSFLLTTDRGATWISYDNESLGNMLPDMMSVFADGVGYGLRGRYTNYQTEDIVFKTEDFWRTAQPVFSLRRSQQSNGSSHLYFRDSHSGWFKYGNEIHRTTNGGIDWVERTPGSSSMILKSIHPNPVSSRSGASIEIEIQGTVPQPVMIEGYSILGRRVGPRISRILAPGRHTVLWDAAAPPGVYFLRVISGTGSVVRKIVVR